MSAIAWGLRALADVNALAGVVAEVLFELAYGQKGGMAG